MTDNQNTDMYSSGVTLPFDAPAHFFAAPHKFFTVSNTPVQYGIHPQCKTLRNWNPLNVFSLATLVDARVCHTGQVEETRSDVPPEA